MRAGALAAGTALKPGTVSPPKSREVTGWLMRRPDALDAHDQQRLACLRTQCPRLDHLADHVTSFAKMITERTGAQELEAWLARVEADDQPEQPVADLECALGVVVVLRRRGRRSTG